MRSPSGFGKNYFTFASILAYSVQSKLEAQVSATSSLFSKSLSSNNDEDDELEESPPELLESPCLVNAKPCHCNCFYKLKTKLALDINLFIPRCPFYTTYFAFRRSGVHPPLNIF